MKKTAPGPCTVRVMGKTYSIQYVEKVDEKDSLGEHELHVQVIKIRENQHAESKRETLLHELVHAIDEQLDLGMKEHQVHRLAIGLFQVLRENDHLVTFLTKKTGASNGR